MMDKKNNNEQRGYRHRILLILFLVICLPLVNNSRTKPEPDGKIIVGISASFSGPTQSLGNDMKLGIETYFKRISREKEIIFEKTEQITITDQDGKNKLVDRHIKSFKTVELIAVDDAYEPDAAKRNMLWLAAQKDVLAVIGNVGTPTAKVTVPVANKKKILLFGAFTGAGLLRKSPPERYILNYRASYAQETAEMIKALKENAGIRPYEIAFFTQDDSYGDAGYDGGVKALEEYYDFTAVDRLAHGRYKRNTIDVEDGVTKILDARIPPRAIIMVGAYAPCAKFIRIVSRALPRTIFLNVSFVGSNSLAKALDGKCNRVIVTQVVPHYDSVLPICRDYKKNLEKYSPGSEPGFVSLEGYIAAKIFCKGLKDAYSRGHLTRESIIDAIKRIRNRDIGLGTLDDGTKIRINYSKDRHQAIDVVWPTVIQGNELKEFDWKDLPKLISGSAGK